MEEQTERLKLPIDGVETSRSNDSWYTVISVLLIVAAVVFAGVGWYTVYNDTYNARLVGGDAYNFHNLRNTRNCSGLRWYRLRSIERYILNLRAHG